MVNISPREFEKLAEYIKSNYGIHLKPEKQSLLMGRLQMVLQQKNMNSFGEYYNSLVTDKTGESLITLVDKITTNHTYFMREPDHFYYFRDNVIPYLERTATSKDLRIWCAGCSTGQEAYTLAMLLADRFKSGGTDWDTKVLATDISSKVLSLAIQGEYATDQLADLPFDWKTNYFIKKNPLSSIVTGKIRNEVIFRKFNLMDEIYPFKKKFHVIFCRNVMIYFDNPTKEKLINKLWDMTEYGGYLFIGHSESLNRDRTNYKYVMPAVYRKE